MYHKIRDPVQDQLKILHAELGKGKPSAKSQSALDELHYLTSFNQNVSFAVGKLNQTPSLHSKKVRIGINPTPLLGKSGYV